MNATTEGRTLHVKLSRRNLLALLQKLDAMGDSACTVLRWCDNGWHVVVTAEPDEIHYAGRAPGSMHPVTETALDRGWAPDDDEAPEH